MVCERKLSSRTALFHPFNAACVLAVSFPSTAARQWGNLMQLIGMLDSPYVRRVAIALIIAKTPFIHRPISLFRHIDQFSKLNPLLKAPTLLTGDGAALMDSNVVLEYLAGIDPHVAALTPSKGRERLAALRATGLALTVMEKAVQRLYERMLRPAEKQHEPWVDRVMRQLTAGLSALDSELPDRDGLAANWALPTSPSYAPSALRAHFWPTSWRRAATPISARSAPTPKRFPRFAPLRRRMGRPPTRSAIDERRLAAESSLVGMLGASRG